MSPNLPKRSGRVGADGATDTGARGSSPMATGPAGAQLEAHVGAQYLLPLLLSAEPRGRPGMTVSSVQFQRGDLGYPMDDVIVSGHDVSGSTAILEVQVKRSIDFTSKSPEFQRVVAMACKSAVLDGADSQSHCVAVATGTSSSVERYVQATLLWARHYQASATFFQRLNIVGAAHQEMRDFVAAFRGHMRTAGAADDENSVWLLLRRFLVLRFDIEHAGSASALLARERCAALLPPQQAARASELWDALGQIALELDAQGGDIDALELRRRLTQERSFQLYGDRRLRTARERIAEDARYVLAAIATEVQGVHLDREEQVRGALAALETGRYLEVRGESGVGKSGLLKALANEIGVESCVLVLAPYRIAAGGWGSMRDQLHCDARAEELLADLAGDGGATLFIDGIDRIENPGERATVVDLLRTAARIPGFRVVTTARMDFDADASAWLPQDAIRQLGQAPIFVISDLSQAERALLRSENIALEALLRPGHPAEKLVGNLYRLQRLARIGASQGAAPYSEAQMAYQWWETGDSAAFANRTERRRLLRDMAVHSLAGSAPFDTNACPSEVLRELTASGTLRAIRLDRHEFTHDVLRDWAIGCLLYDEPNRFENIDRSRPVPVHLARAVDIAARLCCERHQDSSTWHEFVAKAGPPSIHGSWRRAALLSITRSEQFEELFERFADDLLAQKGALLSELLRVAVAVDSRPATEFWREMGIEPSRIPIGVVIPSDVSWYRLAVWCVANASHLPDAIVPDAIDLLGRWCAAFLGRDPLSRKIVKLFHTWLCQSEMKRALSYRSFMPGTIPPEPVGPSLRRTDVETLRQQFLLWSFLEPQLVVDYLQWVAKEKNNEEAFSQLIKMPGSAPRAAPRATVDLFLKCLPQYDKEDSNRHQREIFSRWDLQYFPASPARTPFLEVLNADASEGVRLVRGVVSYALNRATRGKKPSQENLLRIEFPEGSRAFSWPAATYLWSRQAPSSIVASALMALEAWGHQRVERGDAIDAVAADLIGPADGPAAYLLVTIDVLLSHWPASRGTLWRFAASADLLALDRDRFAYDKLKVSTSQDWVHPEPPSSASLASLQQRASRHMSIDSLLDDFALEGPPEFRTAMRASFSQQMQALGVPEKNGRAFADPRFAAWSAFNRLDPANYVQTGVGASGHPEFKYVPPPDEANFLAELRGKIHREQYATTLYLHVSAALRDNRVLTDSTLESALRWAKAQSSTEANEAEAQYTRWMLAALLMRDGTTAVKALHKDWARRQLAEAAIHKLDRLGNTRDIPFNPAAIAAVGLLAGYQSGELLDDLPQLLFLVVQDHTNVAAVVTAELSAGRSIDATLMRSFVRLGFNSEIYAAACRIPLNFHGDWRAEQKRRDEERLAAQELRCKQAVNVELAWLSSAANEPDWPELPAPQLRRRRSHILGITQSERFRQGFEFDSAGASRWLKIAAQLWGQAEPERLRAMLQRFWLWTAGVNGVGVGPDDEAGERAMQWNQAFFEASVQAAASLSADHWEEMVLRPLSMLQEKPLLECASAALFQIDVLWIDQNRIDDSTVLAMRKRIADMMRETRAWKWLIEQQYSDRTEIGFGDLIAKLFVGQHELGKGPRCYLPEAAADRRLALMDLLTQIACDAAGSTFTALAFLNLMAKKTDARCLEFVDRTTTAWFLSQGTQSRFWVDYGIGNHVFLWCQGLSDVELKIQTNAQATLRIADILSKCGLPEGGQLEAKVRLLTPLN